MTSPQIPFARPLPGGRADNGMAGGETAILRVIAALLRQWRTVVAVTVLTFVIAVGSGFAKARQYEVDVSFVPQAPRGVANISGLAAQLGISFPQGEPAQSPQFYVELLKSPEVLRQVVLDSVSLGTPNGRVHASLVDRESAKSPGAPEALRIERAIQNLRKLIAVSVSAKTGIVSFSVTDTNPVLARDLAALLVQKIIQFNQETRQTQASAERRFTEQRLKEATVDLRAAEEARQAFAARNRVFSDASVLNLERERLQREVDTRQQVYTMLSNAYEQARIEEVRDTPAITVLQEPRIPATPLSRGLAIRGIMALLAGALFGALIALMRERLHALRRDGEPAWLEIEAALPRVVRRRGISAGAPDRS